MKTKNKVKLLATATLLTSFLINTGIQSSNQIENNTAQAATNKKKTKLNHRGKSLMVSLVRVVQILNHMIIRVL
ncbi:hypothetical protein QUW39_00220 [Lactobacillus crispatus]|uniref:hypothetical protein n=1 Tax=Lactobacillus crispatus TaxID=47770 RepID=UPI0025A33A54|nr:hypothetical protein [Lactobacillus crispatus]MDM8289740.1 hypothetical protein [Lactobacillus crispatus]